MSRELKFRAWDNYKKEWTLNIMECVSSRTGNIWMEPALKSHKVVIEQYTGLKDKNGKEIYEGDIVKAKIDGLWQTGAHTVSKGKATWNLEVVYNDTRYMDVFHTLGSKNQPNRINYLFDESISDIEVIGNIHENPELLGGKE